MNALLPTTQWPNGATVTTTLLDGGMAEDVVTLAQPQAGLGATVWVMAPRHQSEAERYLAGLHEGQSQEAGPR